MDLGISGEIDESSELVRWWRGDDTMETCTTDWEKAQLLMLSPKTSSMNPT